MLPNELLPVLLLSLLSAASALPLTDKPTKKSNTVPLLHRPSLSSHPLYKRSGDQLCSFAVSEAAKLRSRYGDELEQRRSADQLSKRKRQATVDMTNVNADSEYYAQIEIGQPAVVYNVLVDTGSSDLWLADSSCSSCTSENLVDNNTTSSTLVVSDDPFSITYGSGKTSGILANDQVAWANYYSANQTFALCDQVSPGLLQGDANGLMGLGWPRISSSGATPFWQAVGIQEMGFAFTRYLHDASANVLEFGGYLTLGGTNDTLYEGNITYHDLSAETYWLLEMDAFRVNAEQIDATLSDKVAIDTGTSLIGAPVDQVAAIYAQIPNAARSTDPDYAGYYEFPCDATFNVSFVFNSIEYPIYTRDFNLGTVGSSGGTQMCLGAVFELTAAGLPSWIAGNSFLKSYYTSFRADPPAVGFATLAQNQANVDIRLAVISSASQLSSFSILSLALIVVCVHLL